MIGLAEARWPVWRFLRDELTVSPSRWSRMVRMTAVVTIVTIVSMALRVPDVALSAFLIFMASASDVKTTVRVGVGATIAVTIAVALTLVFYSLTLAEPALRVPAMACVVFAGLSLMRLSAAGPLVWIIGFVSAYALTVDVNLEVRDRRGFSWARLTPVRGRRAESGRASRAGRSWRITACWSSMFWVSPEWARRMFQPSCLRMPSSR